MGMNSLSSNSYRWMRTLSISYRKCSCLDRIFLRYAAYEQPYRIEFQIGSNSKLHPGSLPVNGSDAVANIILKLGGHEITADDLTNPMQAIIVKDMQAQLQQKLQGVVCPEHHKAPIVTISFAAGKQHIAVEGCCQPFIDATMQALLRI